MKKLIIIGVLLLALGGGGYFAYQHFMGGKDKQETAQEVGPDPLNLTYRYVEMPPMNVSVVRGGRVTRIYAALVVLEVKSPEDEQRIKDAMPKLQDAFLSYLFKLSGMTRTVDLSNLTFIKGRLRTIANEQLGGDVVNAVLIQSSFERQV
jgi:flagellar basal body-associated protein FliL